MGSKEEKEKYSPTTAENMLALIEEYKSALQDCYSDLETSRQTARSNKLTVISDEYLQE